MTELVIERKVLGRSKKTYLIDLMTYEILLVKSEHGVNSKFINMLNKPKINTHDLKRFATIDIESLSYKIDKYGNKQLIPFLISCYDFNNNVKFTSLLGHPSFNQGTFLRPLYNLYLHNDKKLLDFLLKLFTKNFHKYRIYAHNLSSFDGIFLLRALIVISDKYNFNIEPLIRDNKIISIRCDYGFRSDTCKYRYYI
jgi:hypothetical protein